MKYNYIGKTIPLWKRLLLPFCTFSMKRKIVKKYGFYVGKDNRKHIIKPISDKEPSPYKNLIPIGQNRKIKTLEELEEFYKNYENNFYDKLLNVLGDRYVFSPNFKKLTKNEERVENEI